jgi:hypothetical protein
VPRTTRFSSNKVLGNRTNSFSGANNRNFGQASTPQKTLPKRNLNANNSARSARSNRSESSQQRNQSSFGNMKGYSSFKANLVKKKPEVSQPQRRPTTAQPTIRASQHRVKTPLTVSKGPVVDAMSSGPGVCHVCNNSESH